MKALKPPPVTPITPITPPTETAQRRIFIVEDHPITRLGLTELINREADLVICGESDGAMPVVDALRMHKPDLVMLDLTLPQQSGLMLLKDIRVWLPQTHVLVMSMHDETLYAERVLRAGGRGYVMKSRGGEELLEAIRHVLEGRIYVSERVSSCIVDAFAGRRQNPDQPSFYTLTDREFEIFQMIGQGLPTSEIGERLHVSPKTVDSHRLHIKEKLRLHKRLDLVRYALRWAATEELL